MASLGWTAVEIVQILRPARDLAVRLGETDQLVAILWNIGNHHLMRCEYSASLKVDDELDRLAQSRNESTAVAVARFAEAHTQCFMGNFAQARAAGEQLLQAYDPAKHGRFVHAFNMDLKGNMLLWGGYWLWALGYPDQAKESVMELVRFAPDLHHPFNTCWALLGGTFALALLGETRLAREWIARARTVAQEHGLNCMADVMAPTHDGAVLIEQGDFAEGYAKCASFATVWRSAGGVHLVPSSDALMARALIGLQRFDEAKALLIEAVEIIERTGHRMHEAEVHRVLGELLRQQTVPDVHGAEAAFIKSLEVARSQYAKGFELRAATSLAQLWQAQGKRREARDLLAPIYKWFSEGFDTRDLRDAKALLDELS